MRAINSSVKYKPALLLSADGKTVLKFDVPPQGFQWSRGADYAALTPLGGSKTFYSRTKSESTSIALSGIVFGRGCDKDVSEVQATIDNLVARGTLVDYAQYRVITGLIIVSYSWEEINHLGGFPTRATCTLNLLQQGDLKDFKPRVTAIDKKLSEAEVKRTIEGAVKALKVKDKDIKPTDLKVDKKSGKVTRGGKQVGTYLKASPFFKANP